MRAAQVTACAWCGGGRQPYALDADGDLVCREGTGCSRVARRHAPVTATRTPSGPAPVVHDAREHCACGRVAEWLELRDRALVGVCARCEEP